MINFLIKIIPLMIVVLFGHLTTAAPPLPEPDDYWVYKVMRDANGAVNKELKLSVFLPDDYNEDKLFPAIVIYHGGSWRTGKPSIHYPDAKYWASRGMIAVSAEYRLKDKDNVPVPLACIQDAKSVIRYLRKNSQELKIDSQKIVSAGGSAGGLLAASLSMIKAENTNTEGEDLSISSEVQAAILYNPWFKCQAELSPSKQVTHQVPPTITFSGGKDPGIPVEEMEQWHYSLKKQGNISQLYIAHEGKHGFCNGRNPRNSFFYWSLELADLFLIEQGILSGKPQVLRPKKVKALTEQEFATYK